MPDLEVSLVLGNHDLAAGRPLAQWNFEVYPREHMVKPFVFRHAPGISPKGYVLAGHLHPSVRVSAGRKSSLRAPCFWFRSDRAVLPAFGEFTGTHVIGAGDGDRVYAVAGGRVVEIPPRLLSR
jgi:metallophosphoesterase superfamily enzyme